MNGDGHDATVGLAPDGQRLLVYADANGGDLEETILKGTAWGKPQRLGGRINSKHHESSAAYSPDGRDIYKVELDGRVPAENLGPSSTRLTARRRCS